MMNGRTIGRAILAVGCGLALGACTRGVQTAVVVNNADPGVSKKGRFVEERKAMDDRAAKSEPLVSEDFDKDLSLWRVERDPEAFTYEIADGRLHVKTVKTKRSEGGYIWLKQELPADFGVEFDFTPVSESGFFLIFFSARSLDGDEDPDLVRPGDGADVRKHGASDSVTGHRSIIAVGQ